MKTTLHHLTLFLFDAFKQEKVSYAILRNYEGLPDNLGSHDIDILVSRKQKPLIHRIMKRYESVFENAHWIRIGERQYVLSYYLSYEEDGRKELLQFDFFYALDWHGRTMLDADAMLAQASEYHGFSILRPAHEAATSLFSSLIRGGFYKEKYHSKIKELIAVDEEEFKRVLSYSVGDAAGALLNAILEDDCRKCERMVGDLRRNITRNSFRHHPWGTIHDMTKFVLWEIRNRICYTGALIAVVGGSQQERLDFAHRLMPLVFKYFKNEGAYEKYIHLPEMMTKGGSPLQIRMDYWKTYVRRIHKQLNKTYGVLMCGYPGSGEIVGKRPELVFTLDRKQTGENGRCSALCPDDELEEALIASIRAHDRSGYSGFIR